ncbi:hypothetical protein JCM19239_900 [Vibrio variabilis]|uniref:Uncharacterized protein n=1 Tax=Vibrio variabilis TaxID=990271 RepID=A0ABQ0JBU3_9VIBR|nr:hypothetical protein JCM19239_900 [Vibrio variabilis]
MVSALNLICKISLDVQGDSMELALIITFVVAAVVMVKKEMAAK